jgi:hypothetical protein
MMKTEYKTQVIQDKIYGDKEYGKGAEFEGKKKLYAIVWQRIANSGLIFVWAHDEEQALQIIGYSPEYVKQTVIEINPSSMPVECGVQG